MKSFQHAFNGIWSGLKLGQNLRVHFVAAILAIVFGFLFKISAIEFLLVLLCIGVVVSLEIINTAIEEVCNFISPQYHQKIKIIKDMAAGSVLFMSIVSFIIALVIFIPKIILCF